MFKNIGKKIMGLAKFFTWMGIIGSALGAIACAVRILAESEELVIPAVLAAAVVFGLGFLASWIGSFLLYGFGQLIQNSEESKLLLQKISEKPAAAPAVPPVPVAPVTPVTPVGGDGGDDSGNGGNGGDDAGGNGGNGGSGGNGGDDGDDEGFGSFGGEGFDELVGKIKF